MKKSKGKSTRPDARAWWGKNRLSCIILAAAVVVFIIVRALAATHEQPQSRGEDYAEYETAVITDILSDSTEQDPVSDNGYRGEQLLLAEIRTGQYKGETMQVSNYVGPLYGQALKEGQRAVVLISTYSDGNHTATVYEYDRAVGLAVIVGLFLLATVAVGGKVGAKSLVALAITLVCLFFIMIPLLMKGAPTLLTVFLVCAYITVVTMVILGGVTSKTICAALGTIAGTALALLFGLQVIIDLFNLLPVNFLGSLGQVSAGITLAFAIFPAVTVALQFGAAKGIITAIVTLLVRQIVQPHLRVRSQRLHHLLAQRAELVLHTPHATRLLLRSHRGRRLRARRHRSAHLLRTDRVRSDAVESQPVAVPRATQASNLHVVAGWNLRQGHVAHSLLGSTHTLARKMLGERLSLRLVDDGIHGHGVTQTVPERTEVLRLEEMRRRQQQQVGELDLDRSVRQHEVAETLLDRSVHHVRVLLSFSQRHQRLGGSTLESTHFQRSFPRHRGTRTKDSLHLEVRLTTQRRHAQRSLRSNAHTTVQKSPLPYAMTLISTRAALESVIRRIIRCVSDCGRKLPTISSGSELPASVGRMCTAGTL